MERFARLLEQLRGYATQACIVGHAASHTFFQLLEELESWQSRFDQLNVKPGAVVGVRADYSIYAVAAMLALSARRAIVALIPRDRDATHYLLDAHAAAFLDLHVDGDYEWRSLTATDHPLIRQLQAAGDSGLVVFTSGSTGRPRAALQSVERFLYKFRKPGRPFRTLAFLMFDHVAGLDTTFYTLASGGTLVVAQRRDPEAILELIESHRVEVLPTSPSFLRMLCATERIAAFNLSSLKIITYGSEMMDPSTLVRLNSCFPNVQIIQKYGTTETGSPKSISRGNDSLWMRIKSDGTETKVVNDVLWIRSESTILGYLNAPSPLDESGWYCTGDLVDVDGEWIRFRGRAVDLINVGGEKVTPAEVEETILELDFVRDAVVAGVPHPLLGQIVAVRVALKSDTLDRKEAAKGIRLHCRQRLAPYKIPVRIEFSDGLLTNSRQKVQRGRMAE